MIKWIFSLFSGGLGGYAIIAVLAGGVSAFVSHSLTHTANQIEILSLQNQIANTKAQSVSVALDQLQGFIAHIHLSETNFQNTLDGINANFSGLKGTLANAIRNKPLPVDCVIDGDRLRAITAATAAANGHSATPAK